MRLITKPLVHLFLSYLITTAPAYAVCIPDSTTSAAPASTSASNTLASWISAQSSTSESALRRNIGSASQPLIPRGVVIASPSTQNPDYYFQWIRDASIVVKHLVDQYVASGANLQYVLDWVGVQKILQGVQNPSGGYSTGGLGEPKFNVDNTAFTGAWGRPQRDGPALRALALMPFAEKYRVVDSGYVSSTLYSNAFPANTVIKADLEYVANNWQLPGFDLWEEVSGQHYFTLAVSHRALLLGAVFANSSASNDPGAAGWYAKQADAIVPVLQSFWSPSKGYLVATLNSGRSGVDAGTLLGVIHAPEVYAPNSAEVLATVEALVAAMKPLYAINTAADAVGVAVGRYPEDIYDGVSTSKGNPWFLTTAAVAHVIYRAVEGFKTAGAVIVTSVSQKFFARVDPALSIGPGSYPTSSITGARLVSGMIALGDGFLEVVKLHGAVNGSLSEEFSRDNGAMRGARDLTWSYEEVLGTFEARAAALAA